MSENKLLQALYQNSNYKPHVEIDKKEIDKNVKVKYYVTSLACSYSNNTHYIFNTSLLTV